MKHITNKIIILSLLVASSVAMANDLILALETDWLGTEVGRTGEVIGAKVTEIESNDENDTTIIEIKMPVKNPERFEGVEVIGKKTQQPIKQQSEAEWFKNYEDGAYGLRLHLKKSSNFEFRIKLIDNEKN